MKKNVKSKLRKIQPKTGDIARLQGEPRELKEASVTFRIEKDLKKKLRKLNIDISKACREYLRKLVEIAQNK